MTKILPLLLVSCVSGGLSLPRVEHYDTRRVAKIAVHRTVGLTVSSAYRTALVEGLETALCLYGILAGDTLFVNEARSAQIVSRTLVSVQFPRENPTGCAESKGLRRDGAYPSPRPSSIRHPKRDGPSGVVERYPVGAVLCGDR